MYVQWSPSTESDGRSVHPRTYEPLQGRPRFILKVAYRRSLPEGPPLPRGGGARHAQLMAVSGGLFSGAASSMPRSETQAARSPA